MMFLSMKKRAFSPLVLASLILAATPVRAQDSVNAPVLEFASRIANVCLGHWEMPSCLGVVSDSNMVLLSNYGEVLQKGGHNDEAEQLKQHCAATTAASQQAVPAYAMHSALTECANTIADIAGKTSMQPDPSHYQLLIAPLLCLGTDPRCAGIESQMQSYKTK